MDEITEFETGKELTCGFYSRTKYVCMVGFGEFVGYLRYVCATMGYLQEGE